VVSDERLELTRTVAEGAAEGGVRATGLFADRFVIEALAGRGGMGVVYRARDRHTGGLVALKLLTLDGDAQLERFRREARVLASLRHPAIVGHVDDGRTPAGDLYIAMEWIEGEPLNELMKRGPLAMTDAVALVRRVAEALGTAHAAGVVHRDIKPANLFLRAGRLEEVVVLDFGLARAASGEPTLTRTGAVLGTPAYMAPEQASGQRDVDARTDVFALGCLLYELVTGVAPFRADTFVATLARVLLEDPAPLRLLAPRAPVDLEALVARMLEKMPAERPQDGASLALALDAIHVPRDDETAERASVRALGDAERRVVTVVLARGMVPDADVGPLSSRHGARLARLADGSSLATFADANAADQAERATALARAIVAAHAGVGVAVATGMSEAGPRTAAWPGGAAALGDAVDRAAALLADPPPGAVVSLDPVRVDVTTARLVESRVAADGRTRAARATAFVGRTRELGLLEALHDESAAEPIARAVLVLGAAGIGKSRLLAELVGRLESRAHPPEILVGTSDAMTAGSSYAMLATLIRRAAGVGPDDGLDEARLKLAARVERVVSGDARAVAEFLGEIAGVPFAAPPGSPLDAARRDPALRGDRMRRAVEDWLAAECARRPVVLVLEDLHWGDGPTVQLVDALLRQLARRPFMVVALGRPETRATFQGLWSARGVEEIQLGPLLRSAAAVLVRARLGDAAPASIVDDIVACSDGHPFLLDELARASAETPGGGEGRAAEARPETAIAVAHGALDRLEADARRVLRAASVFGGAFRRDGVAELLGNGDGLDAWILELDRREVIRRGADATDYLFRHELLREAAYATLTDEDRRLAHGLAGRHLEANGLGDAIALARHFERGGIPGRAIHWYRRSAEHALEGNDISAVLDRVQLALGAGAEGEELGRLWLLRAEAHKWRGENQGAEVDATSAMDLLRAGTRGWFRAASEVAAAAGKLGQRDRLVGIAETLLAVDASVEVDAAKIAWARAAVQLANAGLYDRADALLARIDAAGGAAGATPIAAGHIHEAVAVRGDDLSRIREGARAAAAFEAAGDARNACHMSLFFGFGMNELGGYRAWLPKLRRALASAERLGLVNVAAVANGQLAHALWGIGELGEAEEAAKRAIGSFGAQKNGVMEGTALAYLAAVLLARGEIEAAERNARAALALHAGRAPWQRAASAAILARAQVARGAADDALQSARAASEAMTEGGERTLRKGLVRLALAEALHAAGHEDEARAALADARDRLLARAAQIDEELRADFLTAQPEHARTRSWAAEWLDASVSSAPSTPSPRAS
jgi:predicted Ser/Thr protein kinase